MVKISINQVKLTALPSCPWANEIPHNPLAKVGRDRYEPYRISYRFTVGFIIQYHIWVFTPHIHVE
jgi:hypothetical protein